LTQIVDRVDIVPAWQHARAEAAALDVPDRGLEDVAARPPNVTEKLLPSLPCNRTYAD
jgi:hypothetical protein